jgi:hypothetical protein
MTFSRLIAPLMLVVIVAIAGGEARAQDAGHADQANDPAFAPGNGGSPSANVGAAMSPFPSAGAPPVAGAALPSKADASEECMKEFRPLQEEAEKRGQLIKAASAAHAPPMEACKLIGNFGQAEIRMIRYVESHATTCGIPTQVADQMKGGHKNTEALLRKVCALAQQMQMRGPAGPTGDFEPVGPTSDFDSVRLR